MNIAGYQEKLVQSSGATIGIRAYSRDTFTKFRDPNLNYGVLAAACGDQEVFLRLDSMGHPAVTMDMRGQIIRGSHVTDDDLSIDKYNADIDAVRHELGAKNIALFGYSPGGFFAAHYAIRHPKNVKALILVEPAIFTEGQDLNKRAELAIKGNDVEAMQAMLNYIDPSLDRAISRRVATQVSLDWQSAEIMGKVFQLHADNQLSEKDFSKLQDVPTLLIAGSESPMKFHIERIAKALPSSTLWWVRGATHLDLVLGESAKQIAEVVSLFLSTL